MKLRTITAFALMVVAILWTTAVSADNPHYRRGPSAIDNGFTASATGTITGLGNGDVIITLSFPNATGTTICTNRGGTQAPGQNPAAPVSVSGSQFVDDPKNGTLSFTVVTDAPADPSPQSAGCANFKTWTAAFDNLTFGEGTLTIEQETFQGSGIYVVVLVTNIFLG
jgi:hypothetical protein